ncbi:restriction endonuclease subunit S [Paraburkholderia megapolitana]|uniref:Type I restriction enzyme, S subunit n=1 Tax=Paraburkholderia megapolitana TaxID=420953 RepID=A0A1I3UPA3_9BURK|nr:restriction endonuclease subunit S [Paraburkholderia megapolitana]QDQ82292.1 restriction endonuclease subunit S [Paraburkholderia megapolitana]SFJ84563.1 type I restriction enzyme, S subunit [Paraburkholderia megapolitana]
MSQKQTEQVAETELVVPAGWQSGELLSFLELQRGVDLPVQERRHGDVRIFGSNGLLGFHDRSVVGGPGVITGRSGTIGKLFYTEDEYWPLNTSLYVKGFKGNLPKYVYYKLSEIRLEKFSTGTGVPTLNRNVVHKYVVTFPPLLEQEKIAAILTAVENKLDVIARQIEATQTLKGGLMQTLFSRGVGSQDANGHWRPHTEFKDSELGEIPVGWRTDKLHSHVTKVGSGVTPRGGSDAYLSSGIPLIRSQNVLIGQLSLADVAYISTEQHEKMRNSALMPCDVLLNITGASIGRCAILPANFGEGNVNQHVCIIRPLPSFNPNFLCHYLNSNAGQNQVNKFQAGGNREGLNYQQIRSFDLPVPPAIEQNKISGILDTVNSKLRVLGIKQNHYQSLKRGLMQKLLTGEWRVKVDAVVLDAEPETTS